MPKNTAHLLSAAVAALALVAGTWAWAGQQVDLGLSFAQDGTRVLVADVRPQGVAWRAGVRPGNVVLSLNGAPPSPTTGDDSLRELTVSDESGRVVSIGDTEAYRATLGNGLGPIFLSLALMIVGLAALRAASPSHGNAALAVLAWTLGTFLGLVPAYASGTSLGLAAFWVLPPGSLGLFMWALAPPWHRASWHPRVLPILITCAALVLAGAAALNVAGASDAFSSLRWLTLGAMALGPAAAAGLRAATPGLPGGRHADPGIYMVDRGLASGCVLAGLVGLAAGDSGVAIGVTMLALAVAASLRVAAGSAFDRLARTRRELALVIQASESERAQVAADLHDHVLHGLGLLTRRLERSHDVESANLARAIADDVRGVSADLRPPALDDLGAGAALNYLVEQSRPLVDGRVMLRCEERSRPPKDVELAVCRIAQQALANAIRHGRPPIVLDYTSAGDWVTLIVSDVGAGPDEGSAELALRAGHVGLVNMRQRATAVRGSLSFGRAPAGGTRVVFTWHVT